jgi:ABC-type enterochelin transport system permease subunit
MRREMLHHPAVGSARWPLFRAIFSPIVRLLSRASYFLLAFFVSLVLYLLWIFRAIRAATFECVRLSARRRLGFPATSLNYFVSSSHAFFFTVTSRRSLYPTICSFFSIFFFSFLFFFFFIARARTHTHTHTHKFTWHSFIQFADFTTKLVIGDKKSKLQRDYSLIAVLTYRFA